MTTAEFSNYLYAWNDWVVLPVLALFAFVLHYRRRKPVSWMLLVGLVLLLPRNLLLSIYFHTPLHPLYVAGGVIYFVGAILAIVGSVWYSRKK